MGSPSIVRVRSIRISWLPIDKPKPRQMFSGHSRTSAWSTVVSHSRPCEASMIGNPEAEPLDLSISPADFLQSKPTSSPFEQAGLRGDGRTRPRFFTHGIRSPKVKVGIPSSNSEGRSIDQPPTRSGGCTLFLKWAHMGKVAREWSPDLFYRLVNTNVFNMAGSVGRYRE